MKKSFGKLMVCLAGFFLELMFINIGQQPLGTAILIASKFLVIWAIIWVCSVVAESWRSQMITLGAVLLSFVYAFSIHNPGIVAGFARHKAILNHDSTVSAVASTLRTYSSESCMGFTAFFANDVLNREATIPIVGYVEQSNGRINCYNLKEHPDNPGIDGDGNQIQRVTQKIVERIRAQNTQDRADLKAEQEAQTEARKAAASEEQRQMQATAVPIATVTPLPTLEAPVAYQPTAEPEKQCVIEIVPQKSLKPGKIQEIKAKLNHTLKDHAGMVIAETGTEVKLRVSAPSIDPVTQVATLEFAVLSIKGTTIRGLARPYGLEPQFHRTAKILSWNELMARDPFAGPATETSVVYRVPKVLGLHMTELVCRSM